jgi:uncharacterized SAM-binding protein YcdF (DUF218 family)
MTQLLSPLTLLMLLLLLVAARRRSAGAAYRRTLAVLVVFCLFTMTPLAANWMVQRVESGIPVLPGDECKRTPPDTVVVLSGGFDRPPESPADFGALNLSSLRRLDAAMSIVQRQPSARLVILGGGPYPVPESAALAALAGRMGVPKAQITIETRSLTTWENVHALAALDPPVARRIWLVTSAMHMSRAMAAAQRAGFSSCPQPTDSRFVDASGPMAWFPQSSALRKTESVWHEWAGGLYYAMR